MTARAFLRRALARPWLLLLLIGLVAVIARLAFDATLADRFGDVSNDARSYRSVAHSVANGLGFAEPIYPESAYYRAPLTPLILAVLYRLAGESLATERVFYALLGGVAAAATIILSQRWFGTGAGTAAGLLVAGYPLFLVLAATSLSENLAIPLLVAAVAAGQRTLETRGVRAATATGVLMALCTLSRSAAMVLLLALILSLLGRWGRRALPALVLALGAFVVVLLPWSVYASLANGRFVLVDLQGPLVLYQGNNPYFHESSLWRFHLGEAGEMLPSRAHELVAGYGGEARDRRALELSIQFVREQPLQAGLFALEKAGLFWGWYPHPVDLVATVSTLGLAAVGLLRSLPRWQELLFPLLVVALLMLLHALTTALPRHRMVAMPLVFAFSGYGLMGLLQLAKAGLRMSAAWSRSASAARG